MAIIVRDLSVHYQDHARDAISQIDFCFEKNNAYAICGPNGAGKSTLLKACMRLLRPSRGEIVWQDLQKKDIAYLPQQDALDRTQPITVYELVAMGLWYEIGVFGAVSGQQKKRVDAVLERTGMLSFAHEAVSCLSVGQLQRILFARMLIQDARFLLLDEPFNAVDARTTDALLALLDECRNEGKTVIAVLHDYEQAIAHFPNTLLLAKKMIASGDSASVLSHENLRYASLVISDDDERGQ